MRSVLDEPATSSNAAPQTTIRYRQDEVEAELEAELARKIEQGINEAKEAITEKLEDGKLAAERLLRRGRYAVEDGVSELTHKIKKNPISFLGIAFAAGAAFGLLLAHSSRRQDTE
jgi:ElaB/YqjD/DUF883 family membrane-anchored ribosome-binding protein